MPPAASRAAWRRRGMGVLRPSPRLRTELRAERCARAHWEVAATCAERRATLPCPLRAVRQEHGPSATAREIQNSDGHPQSANGKRVRRRVPVRAPRRRMSPCQGRTRPVNLEMQAIAAVAHARARSWRLQQEEGLGARHQPHIAARVRAPPESDAECGLLEPLAQHTKLPRREE